MRMKTTYLQFTGLILFVILFLINNIKILAQVPGDTIKIQAFDYSSPNRDTLIQFPDGNLSYEKIIMKYNMRCKNALVSTGEDRNKGCGEWDYSCNTYIVDSSKVEAAEYTHPNYLISSFDGEEFNYTTQPVFDYIQFKQDNIIVTSTGDENLFVLNDGSETTDLCMNASQVSGKTQILYTATEMIDAGFSSGAIDGIILNVANDGGQVNFLRIKIKSVNSSEIDITKVKSLGFDEVYFSNYTFQNGENRIHFANPFEWNGTSNLIFELSYTNTVGQDKIVFDGATVDNLQAVYSNNNYSIDLSNDGLINIDPSNLVGIKEEITVSFWTYGYDDLPANTTIIWANGDEKSERAINVHLPWSNSHVYFDCGYEDGFDRVEKLAYDNSYKGKWNHWAFVKNTNTSEMKIYHNGTLFVKKTGKTKDINILEMILGSDYRHKNNYKGRISEFRVWDKALSTSHIKGWKDIPITDEHPYYSNLVAYYPMQEGSSNTIFDSKNSSTSVGENIYWDFERGVELSRDFKISTVKPKLTLYRGSYNVQLSEKIVLDSVKRNENSIKAYSIITKSGLKDDEIVLDSSFVLYEARNSTVIDYETGEIIESTPIDAEGTISIEELDYTRRFPFYNELVSFVTPYGIGLDLGENGKSWYFDVTDYAPILKGEKGLKMSQGGQWQEEFDIEFWFIVGTPPRDVLAFDQIWQGATRIGAPNIFDLYNDKVIKPVTLNTHTDGKSFKIKSTITGHGSEGEFRQNGGYVYHSFKIDGEDVDIWEVHKECSENPIYPQGGTWVIDRQGWCPGERSFLKEIDITEYITAGSPVSLDYGISQAQNANGDYRYLMSHQLVTYGDANHNLDASVKEVLNPSNDVLYSRFNPICTNPSVVIQNTGATKLQSLDIEYWINDASKKVKFHWTGSLDFMETKTVSLPAEDVFLSASSGNNTFHVKLLNPNGGTDEYPHNSQYNSSFILSDILPDEFIIEVRTNNLPNQNFYKIYDQEGNTIMTNNLNNANTSYNDTIRLSGCYSFVIVDTGNDGLQWWANPGQGSGYAKIKNIDGSTIKSFEADFGGKFTYGFSTNTANKVTNEKWDKEVKISPNPSNGLLYIEGEELKLVEFGLYDMLGHKVLSPSIHGSNIVQFDGSILSTGVYFIKMQDGEKVLTRKIVIE